MPEAALPSSDGFPEQQGTPEATKLQESIKVSIGNIKSRVGAMRAAFDRLRDHPATIPDQTEFDRLLLESDKLTDTVTKAVVVNGEESNREGQDRPDIGDVGTTGGTDQSMGQPRLTESEILNRRELVKAFSINFLHTLNPDISQGSLDSFFDERDIFADIPDEEIPDDVRVLKGYGDMLALAKYYDSHSLEVVPEYTIVLGSQKVIDSLTDKKALVYVKQLSKRRGGSYKMIATGEEHVEEYDEIVPRKKRDVITFKGGERKVKPDVYIESISDKTERNGKREGNLRGETLRKKSFKIAGVDAVIIGGSIQPEIKRVDISCTGGVTVLPGASLTPASLEGRTTITIKTPGTIEVQEGGKLAASAYTCEVFNREAGAEIINPHPSQDLVEIGCNTFNDNNNEPLNPQLFEINDTEYKRRQTEFWGTIHRARMAQGELTGNELENLNRSEQVSDFAVNFLFEINKGRIGKERIMTELFGRGARGTRDTPMFLSTVESNIAAWQEGEAAKPEHERAIIRGIEDMFRIVEYYMQNPHRTLPTQIVILGKEKNISRKIKKDKKALVYWAGEWVETVERDEESYEKARLFGQSPRKTQREQVKMTLDRSAYDRLTVDKRKNKPDLFISNLSYSPKIETEIKGFENIIVGGYVKVFYLKIICTGELAVLPSAQLMALINLGNGGGKSFIKAGQVTQEGDISLPDTTCDGVYKRVGGHLSHSAPGPVNLVCERFEGENPDEKIKVIERSPISRLH